MMLPFVRSGPNISSIDTNASIRIRSITQWINTSVRCSCSSESRHVCADNAPLTQVHFAPPPPRCVVFSNHASCEWKAQHHVELLYSCEWNHTKHDVGEKMSKTWRSTKKKRKRKISKRNKEKKKKDRPPTQRSEVTVTVLSERQRTSS